MKINNQSIIKDNDPRIRVKSEDVSLPLSNEDRDLLLSMLEYVENSQDSELCEKYDLSPAVGIAAIQLGIAKKMLAIVVPVDEDEVIEFALVNAKIVSESAQRAYLKDGEGCLSVPESHVGHVPRAARIKVKAYDLLQDKEVTIEAYDYLAIVLQHEIDHFSGRLYYDRINKLEPWQDIEEAIII